MKKLLIKYGIPSVALTILGAIWMIGTTEFKDGKTFLVYWHEHFIQPSDYQLASNRTLNEKVNVKDMVLSYEYLLEKHLNDKDIDDYCSTHTAQKCNLKQMRWNAETIKKQQKLNHIRKMYRQSELKIEQLLAGHIPSE